MPYLLPRAGPALSLVGGVVIDKRQQALAGLPSISGQQWRQRAACAGDWNGDPWFPGDKSNDPHRYDYARAVCARCPVRSECLEFALETREQHGMFGGLTPDQRKALARKRDAA